MRGYNISFYLTNLPLSCIIKSAALEIVFCGEVRKLPKKVSKVQEALSQYIGSSVTLRANSGRRKYIERSGILEGTYANLFVVRVEDRAVERKLSFSYVDLLTGNVLLFVNQDGQDYRLVVNQS